MRSFNDGDTIVIEPWRANAFPVIKDLVVDRGAFDRIIQAGGYVSVATGGAKDANNIPIPKTDADSAMDAAACIGCGACVAACPNASASLFTSAKISHLGLLPQGQPERYRRALKMVAQMDLENFGGCTLFGECQEACPKSISIDFIGRMNRDYMYASATAVEERSGGGEGWSSLQLRYLRVLGDLEGQRRQHPIRAGSPPTAARHDARRRCCLQPPAKATTRRAAHSLEAAGTQAQPHVEATERARRHGGPAHAGHEAIVRSER